ncbi:PE family protein [Mycobacterium sp. CBMA271]|uniref:PE family protein n=1 Tax=unclassified Mycobacteroides TaxID=2618759 RepID=UPI0012DDA57E|nr:MULTISPECIES: PE family protein [unclassified Mycobacteroides]MUM20058.1 cell motility protein [Mycobacteroides sp. CBMA 326]MUM23994.1 PE family protein [Mycobacteroides sp. CBMA 271]
MSLNVVPEGLMAAGAAVEALTARLAAAHAAAAPVITVVVPPAADPVSIQNAAVFSAHAVEREGAATGAVSELGRAGIGVSEGAVSYTVGDMHAAAAYMPWLAG